MEISTAVMTVAGAATLPPLQKLILFLVCRVKRILPGLFRSKQAEWV
jgi:hypothetical protein